MFRPSSLGHYKETSLYRDLLPDDGIFHTGLLTCHQVTSLDKDLSPNNGLMKRAETCSQLLSYNL
jgi:hypothetical protein